MPTPTWSHLKPHLQRLDKEQLLALLRELYGLNADNKVFLATRFIPAAPEQMAEPYRKVVRQVFNPDRGHPSLQLSAARKALNDFKKACNDPLLLIDFMLFYVEEGVVCTRTYGDINAPFYSSLLSVYRSAAELTRGLKDPHSMDTFQPRFLAIIRDTPMIGWGFQEGLIDIYTSVLPTYWEV
ncbi:MAG: DUF6155 family protein [Anaerolineae bacterium]